MDGRLAPLDVRFAAATEDVSRQLPGGGDDRWATRLPRVLVGELAEDADRMSLGELRR
jgi:hypothetical protein